jgi:transglutaminase superfamily protein
MTRYLLAPHSFACEAGGHGVFLDLKHDKYTAISPQDLRTLRRAVEGWTAGPAAITQSVALAPESGTPQPQEEDVIATLLKEGLLTADASNGKAATLPTLAEPTTSLWEFPRPWPELDTHHLWNFFCAWAATTVRLRTLPIRFVVNRLREEEVLRRRQSAAFDIHKARLLTTIHFALQPAFYSAQDACLRNSLTLVEFLGKYEVYPTCVFGVKMDPFAAHAWVQQGAVVLTDPIEHVKTFTPIMLV